MIGSLLALWVLQGSEGTAADYINLRAGERHFYEEKSMTSSATEDEVLKEVDVSGQKVIPVVTRQGGRTVNMTYYKVEPDGVSIVGYDAAKPLPSPLPIFKFAGKKKMSWTFEGLSGTGDSAEPMQMVGDAQVKGERTVLGKKVAVLEVNITAVVGRGIAAEQVKQVALYGRGVGLFQLTSTTRINKRMVTSVLKLVKTEGAKGGD